jgi:hypothetical protein
MPEIILKSVGSKERNLHSVTLNNPADTRICLVHIPVAKLEHKHRVQRSTVAVLFILFRTVPGSILVFCGCICTPSVNVASPLAHTKFSSLFHQHQSCP